MAFHNVQDEMLDRDGIERLQSEKLIRLWREAVEQSQFYRRKFEGLPPIGRLLDLSKYPYTTRAELEYDQELYPPYGTNLTRPLEEYVRFHQTSGTGGRALRRLDTKESWQWWKYCWSIVYRAAGLAACDRIVFAFSFGPFIGFWSAFEAAVDLGNLCLAAGGMTTTARLRYIIDNEATVVCCTPTYALHMAETARTEGIDLMHSRVRLLIVAGEPGGNIPTVRSRMEAEWGARVIDHAGMTELGAWGFECFESSGGIHINETEFIAEVIDPQTGSQVGFGGAGELVLTNLGRVGSPLIRYRTGDEVRLTRDQCACGRWFVRAEGGVLGRADDMLIIRGVNVFPSAIEAIVRDFGEIAEFRMRVQKNGPLNELLIEVEPKPMTGGTVSAVARSNQALVERLINAVQVRLQFRPLVTLLSPGTLPRFEMKSRRLLRE